MIKKVATIISRLFDPPIVMVLMTFVAACLSDLSHLEKQGLLILLPLMLGLPVAYLIWKIKTHQVSNWDISHREERIQPLLALLGFVFIDVVIISFFNNAFLLNVFLLYLLWLLGFLLITIFWKISGHSGIATLAFGLFVRWFGPAAFPFFLAVILVSWARVVRKDHTLPQVIAGIVYSLLILTLWSIIVVQ